MQNIDYDLFRFIRSHQTGGGIKGGKRRHWWNLFDYFTTKGQCAGWSNTLLRKNGYRIFGDAWNLKGPRLVFNGYARVRKPKNTDRDSLVAYNQAAADNVLRNFNSGSLDKDRPYVVNLTVDGSPNMERAYKEGKDVKGSHTGILTWEGDKWKVTHNLHGYIAQDDFLDLQKPNHSIRVTAIYGLDKNN